MSPAGPEGSTAAEVAARLGLRPHREGGYFTETYRSPMIVPTPVGPRSLATAILYLLTTESPSRFHRLRFDEVWFYHAGAPAEMFLLGPGGAGGAGAVDGPRAHDPAAVERRLVGPGLPQTVVPGMRWMAARVLSEGLGPSGLVALGGAVAAPVAVAGPAAVPAEPAAPGPQPVALGPRVTEGPAPPGSGGWTLVGCVVSPGFEYEDFELGAREALLAAYPRAVGLICALT